MKKSEITNEIIEKVGEVYEKEKTIRKTHKALKESLNLTFHNVRYIVNNNFSTELWAQKDLTYEFEEKGEKATVNIKTNKRIKTLEDLIAQCSIDIDNYEIEKHIVNKRDGHSKDNDWNTQITELFQVKARMKPRKSLNMKQVKEEIKTELKKYSPSKEKIEVPKDNNAKLLEICPKDLHFNKKADKDISGDKYNTDIAEERFEQTIWKAISYVENFKIDKIVLILWSDMMNVDNIQNTTTSWTPQDIFEEHRKAVKRARQFLTKQIEKLQNTVGVWIDVVIVPWNHDYETSFHIGDSLECIFENNENVNIENSLQSRKYYEYWNNCIALTHWKDEKPSGLPLIALQEMRKKWITAENVEIHRGHFHKKKEISYTWVDENTWIVDRVVSSLSWTDERHFNKWYVNNRKALDCFVWDKQDGVIMNLNIKW